MEEKKSHLKYCEICRENATCLCFTCLNYFCESCFKYIHDKPKNSEHKKENIDLYVPMDLKCKEHPHSPLNLFCFDEKGNSIFFI